MKRKTALFGLVVAMIAGTAVLLSWLKAHQKLGNPGVRLALPAKVLEFQSGSESLEMTKIEAATLPKDTSLARRVYYRVTNGVTNSMMQVSIVLMGTDRTSIHNPQLCLTGQGWKIERSEPATIRINKPHPYDLPVMRMMTKGAKRLPENSSREVEFRALYVYWFVAENRLTASHRERMWWMAKDLISTGVLERWAYVSCFAVCYPGQEAEMYTAMTRLLSGAVPEFQTATLPTSPNGEIGPLGSRK
jgi:hypothetical protein